jgi:hypothetical protein
MDRIEFENAVHADMIIYLFKNRQKCFWEIAIKRQLVELMFYGATTP